MPSLEPGDLTLMAQRQADFIHPLEQTVLAERIDLERIDLAIGPDHLLRRQIDGDAAAARCEPTRPAQLPCGGPLKRCRSPVPHQKQPRNAAIPMMR